MILKIDKGKRLPASGRSLFKIRMGFVRHNVDQTHPDHGRSDRCGLGDRERILTPFHTGELLTILNGLWRVRGPNTANGFREFALCPDEGNVRSSNGSLARVVEHDFPEQGYVVRRPTALGARLAAYAAATATTASYNAIRAVT